MRVVWDESKRRRNLLPPPQGHGLDFADARDRFEWETAAIAPTRVGPDGKERFRAIGVLDGAIVFLVFAHLGSEAVSLISLRPAGRKERIKYADRS